MRALAEAAGDAGRYVHWGATSQDILDTAAMLVARGALDLILAELDAVTAACAALAEAHRSTPIAGRTLMQQALPTTFGLKAAGWLVGVLEARSRLAAVRDERLAVQLGGGAGTLAALGEQGPAVLALFAEELGLAEPALPWHANRVRVAELGARSTSRPALSPSSRSTSCCCRRPRSARSPSRAPAAPRRMPQKRNPTGSRHRDRLRPPRARAGRAARGGLAQEHERAAGGWHAEWQPLSDALALTGGAAAAVREVLEGLEIQPERMRANLDATNGLIMAERITFLLAERIGRIQAHELVSEACARAAAARPPAPRRARIRPADRADPGGARRRVRPDRLSRLRRGVRRAGPRPLPPARRHAMSDPTHDRGMEVRRAVLGDAHVDRAIARTNDFTADFQDLITRYAWGEIWSRPGLDRRMRSAITLTALVALNRPEELAMHLRAALRNGLTPDEIKEVLLQSAIYCGVPAANSAFAIAQEVLEEGSPPA